MLYEVITSFFGDGASNIGAFHEGINLAAVKNAPVVFVCENNQYAASTHISLAMKIENIANRAASYGIPGVIVDGMDVIAVRQVTKEAVERARKSNGPTLIEAKTYRFMGHSRGDPGKYRDVITSYSIHYTKLYEMLFFIHGKTLLFTRSFADAWNSEGYEIVIYVVLIILGITMSRKKFS